MTFLHPDGLLLLGLIPILLLIHSLRPKPKELEVTTLFLWNEVLQEWKGGSRIRTLIRNLPLLLQILTVIAASLALAEPVRNRSIRIQGDALLIMDVSASMQARTPSGTRLDFAKQEALKLIEALSGESRMLILEAAHRPKVLSPFVKDKGRLRRTVADLKPLEVSGDLEGALYLALSFLDADQEDRIFLLSDGAWTGLSPELRNHPKVVPLLVPHEGENIGIIRFECRPNPDMEHLFQGWLEIGNFQPRPVVVPLTVKAGAKVLFGNTVALRPWEKKRLLFPFPAPAGTVVQASLEVQDDLEVDNRAFFVIPPVEEVDVFLVSRGNYFLETLLAAFSDFKIQKIKEIPRSAWKERTQGRDLIILDGVPPPALLPGNYLLINTLPPSPEVSLLGRQAHPTVVAWEEGHPILQNLDPTDLSVEAAPLIRLSSEWKAIVEGRQGGLIYTREGPGLRAVLINFDLRRSDLPRRVAFPVLLANCFRWLQPYRSQERPGQVKAGEPIMIFPKSAASSLSLTFPSGKPSFLATSGRPLLFRETGKTGIYKVQEGKRETLFAVNLFSEAESDLRLPPSLLKENPLSEKPKKGPGQRPVPLWFLVLPFSLILLIVEFAAWLRRR